MSNNLFNRIGAALTTIGALFLLASIAQSLLGLTIFEQPPTLPALTMLLSGVAFLVAGKAGE